MLSISSLSVSAWAVSASRDGHDTEWRNIPVFSFLILTGLLRLMVPSLFAVQSTINVQKLFLPSLPYAVLRLCLLLATSKKGFKASISF